MECALRIAPSPVCLLPKISACNCGLRRKLPSIGHGNHQSGAISLSSSSKPRAVQCALEDVHTQSSLESRFCYDKPIPEEIIEKPIGIALAEKNVGDNPRCTSCQAKGALLCNTCSGSGLYVESILESQGIIVKVRCLGCGGTGNIMCSECGGRGHV